MKVTQQQVRLALIFVLGIVSFGLVVWAELTHNPIDATISTLLGIVLGFITAQTSTQQGVDTANQQANIPASLNLRVVHRPDTSPTSTTDQSETDQGVERGVVSPNVASE